MFAAWRVVACNDRKGHVKEEGRVLCKKYVRLDVYSLILARKKVGD